MDQHFFIKRGSTLPYLAVELEPTRYTTDDQFYEKILNANISFYMKGINCDTYKIKCKAAQVYEQMNCDDSCGKQIFILYQFSQRETKVAGTYEGYFEIEFLDGCGKLIAPINKKFIINILD